MTIVYVVTPGDCAEPLSVLTDSAQAEQLAELRRGNVTQTVLLDGQAGAEVIADELKEWGP